MGSKFGPGVKIGNWNEDVYLKEVGHISTQPQLAFNLPIATSRSMRCL